MQIHTYTIIVVADTLTCVVQGQAMANPSGFGNDDTQQQVRGLKWFYVHYSAIRHILPNDVVQDILRLVVCSVIIITMAMI